MERPVRKQQIEAALTLHSELPFWKAADEALEQMLDKFQHFTQMECLVKAAAINQFYGTNVYALFRQANRVQEVMSSNPRPDGPDLVEALAKVTDEDGVSRRNLSFASKFAHFFIDSEEYAICDSYAVKTLRHHLPDERLRIDPLPAYDKFIQAFKRLLRISNLTCSGRDLDRYLWLSGLYRAWEPDHEAQINVEARQLFVRAANDKKLRDKLRLLIESCE